MTVTQPIYQLRPSEVFEALDTSAAGVPAAEVAARQGLYGFNRLAEQRGTPLWQRYVQHVLHPFSVLLLVAGTLAWLAQQPVLGAVIWGLVLVNSNLSFWREYRAEQAMRALRSLLPAYVRAIRDGAEQNIPAEELVPGDVLVLAEGDHVPADARVIQEFGLRVSNATLTGEPVPARKTADASFQDGLSELDRPNLVFAGTSIVSGTGWAVVFATGMLTQFGRVAYFTQAARAQSSPLQAELLQITRKISYAVFGIALLVCAIGITELGMSWLEAFLLFLGILVAAIPEGLPASFTLSLAVAGQRLAQNGVLVKRLSAIETLGNISLICTDKSGTLTQNQMTVTALWAGGVKFTVSGVGYVPEGEILPVDQAKGATTDLDLLLTAASLCNNSRLSEPTPEKPVWSSLGDQTEAALRVAVRKGGLSEPALAARYPRLHELPFDARRKRMSTIHRYTNGRRATPVEVAFIKGAPRELLEICTHLQLGDQAAPLDEGWRAEVQQVMDDYAAQTLRVLGLAYRRLPLNTAGYASAGVERELTFLGLMAMHDPARPEVQQAVQTCKAAGIRMVMITGDYGLTAMALARKVGLVEAAGSSVITGADLDEMSDTDLAGLLDRQLVYARMAPEHKLRLVSAFQAHGAVVAVTGDGVNDAPALRKADIGVAMGLTGTDVAKEAAEIILTQDNFAHLVQAIEEGRAVYENLRKFITYIFSSNVPEILPFILTALVNLPLALTVKQILAIDLGTDLLPALALGTEKPEPGLMQRPPRPPDQRLIDNGVLARAFLWLGPLEALLAYSGFFLVYLLYSPGLEVQCTWLVALKQALTGAGWLAPVSSVPLLAITVFHIGVVTAQVGNAFACRTATQRGRTLGWFRNRNLWLAVGAELLMILALVYVPPLAAAFEHIAIPAWLWLWLVLYAPALYAFDWLRKQLAHIIHQRKKISSG